MGAWGIRALDSDEGLDTLDFLAESYLPEHKTLDLAEVIAWMREFDCLGENPDDIDFFYDNNAMVLAELYLEWLDKGKLDFGDEENPWSKVQGFTATNEGLDALLHYLHDIKNEVPDEDGIRESVELWRNDGKNPNFGKWQQHLDNLIQRLEQAKK